MQDLISNTINWVQRLQPGAQSAFSTSVVQVWITSDMISCKFMLPSSLSTSFQETGPSSKRRLSLHFNLRGSYDSVDRKLMVTKRNMPLITHGPMAIGQQAPVVVGDKTLHAGSGHNFRRPGNDW